MFKSQFSTLSKEGSQKQFFAFTNIPQNLHAELYPRKRKTEHFYEPAPTTEFQSREAEHPKKFLELYKKTEYSKDNRTISPPTNSDTRMTRDSYFS